MIIGSFKEQTICRYWQLEHSTNPALRFLDSVNTGGSISLPSTIFRPQLHLVNFFFPLLDFETWLYMSIDGAFTATLSAVTPLCP